MKSRTRWVIQVEPEPSGPYWSHTSVWDQYGPGKGGVEDERGAATPLLTSANVRQKIARGGVARFVCYLRPGWIEGMPAVKGRKHQVGVSDAVQLGARVQPDRKQKATEVAAALGISVNAYIDALLEHEQLDAHGRPTWWNRPVPADQKEMPLKSA